MSRLKYVCPAAQSNHCLRRPQDEALHTKLLIQRLVKTDPSLRAARDFVGFVMLQLNSKRGFVVSSSKQSSEYVVILTAKT